MTRTIMTIKAVLMVDMTARFHVQPWGLGTLSKYQWTKQPGRGGVPGMDRLFCQQLVFLRHV